MNDDDDYRARVSAHLTADLLGTLDSENPRIRIDRIRDTTDASGASVLRVEVQAQVEGEATDRIFVFDYDEWEAYLDTSPRSMAEGLGVLIRSDIREEIATAVPPS